MKRVQENHIAFECTDKCRTLQLKAIDMKTTESARLELRLTKQKKAFFEQIASLGGFKSLSDFIIHSADQQASKISEERKKILASEKDRKLFFDALMAPPKPNPALKKAFKRYNDARSTK